jgi:HAD superfamily hydrolase (TIGR01484 family)
MKTVFLFDLDGTLCKSRKPVINKLVSLLVEVNKNHEIGILTGSDLDFLQEQCKDLFKALGYEQKVYAMACNGTKSFLVSLNSESNVKYTLIKEENLREKIGEEKFKAVMRELIYEQTESMIDYDFPLTGNFITYRGPIINWCPVGRCANDADRNAFKKEDKLKNIRTTHVENIKRSFIENNITNLTVTVAGDTSFDIYPTSWDKTYVMQFFEGYDIYFWGDRMTEGGNDYSMHIRQDVNSFPVENPNETYKSVKETIKNLLENKDAN